MGKRSKNETEQQSQTNKMQLEDAFRQFQEKSSAEENKAAAAKAAEEAEAAQAQWELESAISSKSDPATIRGLMSRLAALRGSGAQAVSSAAAAEVEAETRVSPVASVTQTAVTIAAGAAMVGETSTFFNALAKGGHTLDVAHNGSFDHAVFNDRSKLKKASGNELQDAFANIEVATNENARAKVMAETGMDSATLMRHTLPKLDRSIDMMEKYEAAKVLVNSKSLEEAAGKIKDNHKTFAQAKAKIREVRTKQAQMDARKDISPDVRVAGERALQIELSNALKPVHELLVKDGGGYLAVAGDVNQKNPNDLGGLVASLVPNVLKPKSKPPLAMPNSSQSV